MPKQTVIAHARIRANIHDIDKEFDRVFTILELEARDITLATFGHGNSVSVRLREGSIIADILAQTPNLLLLAGGIGGGLLGVQKFLSEYPKMKEGLGVLVSDTQKFSDRLYKRFSDDLAEIPITDVTFETRSSGPDLLLSFVDTLEAISSAKTSERRQERTQLAYKLAKELKTVLSDQDKQTLLVTLREANSPDLAKYEQTLLPAQQAGGKPRSEGLHSEMFGISKLEEELILLGRKKRSRRRTFKV